MMKKILPFYLYPNYFKIIGILPCISGLFLAYFIDPGYQILFYVGLILIVYAKEKEESDLVVQIRAESFKTTLGYILALLVTLYLMDIIYSGFNFPCSMPLLIGIPMLFYLVYFHLLLLVNRGQDGKTGKGSMLRNILWLLFTVVGGVLLVIRFI